MKLLPLSVPAVLLAAAMPLLAQAPPTPTPGPRPPAPLPIREVNGTPLTADQEKEALEFMLTQAEDRAAEQRSVQALKSRSPESYWAHLRSVLENKKNLADLKAEDPQRYELYQREQALHRRVDALSTQYRQATTDAARTKVRGDLKTTLGELFDVREQQRTAAEVARLQREIRQEQERNAQRRTQKDQIVEDQLQHFTAQ